MAFNATILWTQYLGSSLKTDSAKSLTIGLDGAIYVGGIYGFVQGIAGNKDFITRYNPDGTVAWTKFLDSAGGVEYDLSLTTGANGAIYVAFHGGFGRYSSTIASYTPDGYKSWDKAIGIGATITTASILTTGADGAIYLSGGTSANLDGQTNNGNGDAFISRYNPDGTWLWTKLLGSAWGEGANCLTTGADGFIYVAGATSGNLDGNTLQGLSDAFIACYNPDGTKLWTNTLGGSSGTFTSGGLIQSPVFPKTTATSVTVGTDGAIYMAGYTSAKFLDGLANMGANDAFITRYNPDGTKDWTRLFGGANSYYDDRATCLTAGTNGEIYVGAYQTFNKVSQAFITRYNSDGTRVWTQGLGTNVASSLAFGPDGAMYVAGDSNGDASITKLFVDTIAPTVSRFSPTDAAVNVAVSANVVLTFSEDVVKGTGKIEIRAGSVSGFLVESFDASISSNTLTIDPSNNLAGNTEYFVILDAGSIQDFSGNSYAGNTIYKFTTGAAPDTLAPTVTAFSPSDEATAVDIGANVVVTFSEAIQRGVGSISLKKADGTTIATYVQSSTEVTVSDSTLTINPTADLNYSTGYKVEFAAGSVQDLAGNNYAGISTYNFTTAKAINYAPQASSRSFTTEEDTAKIGALAGTDAEGSTLTFAKVSDPSHGSVTINATTGAYTYTPAANYSGADSFTFKVNDGTLDSSAATVSITVNAVNDAPTLQQALADYRVTENRTLSVTVSTTSFADVDDATLTYSAKLASGSALPNWMQFNATTRTFSISPGVDLVDAAAQTFALTVTATDSGGLTTSDSFDVMVRPLGSGYDIQANVAFWKADSSGQKPKLAGVSLTQGSESGTSTAQAGITLSSVEDTQGADDGFMALSPQASSPSNAKSAITLTDVLAALKVYLGKSLPDSYTSPLNYIAADFDANGTVNLTDVLTLLKYYLGKSTTSAPAWAFVDAADFSSDGKSLTGVNNQAISKSDATPHVIDQSFDNGHESIQIIGVLRGDVDGSWNS